MIRIRASASIVRDGRILLIEYDDPNSDPALHYNLPGGGLEATESLLDGVRREVVEETTARIEVGPLLMTWEVLTEIPAALRDELLPPNKHYHHLGFVFRATLLPDSPEPLLPPVPDAYQTAVRWVPLANLPNMPLLPYMADRLLQALATPPGPYLFGDATDPLGYGE